MAELADDEFAGTGCCSMVGEDGEGGGCVGAGWTWDRVWRVVDGEVFPFAERRVPVRGVVRTMPVVSPFGGGLLEDGAAVGTEDVVS